MLGYIEDQTDSSVKGDIMKIFWYLKLNFDLENRNRSDLAKYEIL